MTMKMLLDTLKMADDGHVECSVAAPDGTVLQGVIEQSFFEDFKVASAVTPAVAKVTETGPQAEAAKRAEAARLHRIVSANTGFFEGEFDKQWRMGGRVFVLR